MPQHESPEFDGRTPAEKEEFDLMLGSITDLYLTAMVLILLDMTYMGRFWTLLEAFFSLMRATAEGVRAATDLERRCTIKCIHNAKQQFEQPKLIDLVATKTPQEMHDILASPDVCVTNAKDKETMLPVVSKTNEHVKEMMRP